MGEAKIKCNAAVVLVCVCPFYPLCSSVCTWQQIYAYEPGRGADGERQRQLNEEEPNRRGERIKVPRVANLFR